MPEKMTISPLLHDEIKSLEMLQPEGWMDIRDVFHLHQGKSYFSAYKGLIDGELASVGQIIYCGNIAWPGNVIVHPSQRNKGLGTQMTQFLMDQAKIHGASSVYLLATDLGKRVYDKIGFITHDQYAFNDIKCERDPFHDGSFIRKFQQEDWTHVRDLDHRAMGYDRSSILSHFLDETWVYEDEKVRGFYVRNLGDGLIIASDANAGWSLSNLRVSDGKNYLVIPKQQLPVLSSLYSKNHYKLHTQQRKAYFMYIGSKPVYDPAMIYSRIGGYLG